MVKLATPKTNILKERTDIAVGKRPNVLFLLSDEHSFRFMGHCSKEEGGEPVSTPNLDRLAAQGTVLGTAYCQSPLCTPSRISMLTGTEVAKCGAWTNKSMIFPDTITLPKAMADSGYTTCLVGKMHFGGTFQFNGFQYRPYGDITGNAGHQRNPITPTSANSGGNRTKGAGILEVPESALQENICMMETLSFLREHRHSHPDKPWFVCTSFSRPHFPLLAPKRKLEKYWSNGVTKPFVPKSGDTLDHPRTNLLRKRFKTEEIDEEEMLYARAAYFACVDYLDEIIGDMLALLEKEHFLDNTIIIYTSDHGELAGEHGLWWKQGWHEGCTRVPFIISLPQQRKGEVNAGRINTPVSLADLFPTVCGLTDIEIPQGLDGINLADCIKSVKEPETRPVFCDMRNGEPNDDTDFRMIRYGSYKYVAFKNAPDLLFNIEKDPKEQKNLTSSVNPKDIAMLEKLRTIADETIDYKAISDKRKADMEWWKSHQNGDTHGNLYLLSNGCLISSEKHLYKPEVVTDNAATFFEDFPIK